MSFIPTPEQAQALDLFDTGDRLVIQARAGAGKTSTLSLLARNAGYDDKRVTYVAFNKQLVVDAAGKFGRNTTCSTAHSLAYQAVGRRYAHRMAGSRRMHSEAIAKVLGIDPIDLTTHEGHRHLTAKFLAGHVMRTVSRFCQTADPQITLDHFPRIKGIDKTIIGADGLLHPGTANNVEVAKELLPKARKAWADLADRNGRLQYKHEHYLKLWQLDEKPFIFADVILWDEVQDASDVMLDIVMRQPHAQLVAVGDSEQAIYEWAGAVDALTKIPDAQQAWLTQSFRFGPRIARTANLVLDWLAAEPHVRGTSSILDTVAHQVNPDAILCRSNGKALEAVLDAIDHEIPVALVGGADDLVRFAWAAKDLKEGRRTDHPELACFANWAEVLVYVEEDPQGGELKLLVDLVQRYSPGLITAMLHECVDEANARLVVSTAHKSKGREWSTVKLAGDFPDVPPELVAEVDDSELRLLYVAVTRAKTGLDVESVPLFFNTHEAVPTHV